ncbi:MAG: hypothetical protein QX189_16565 [Methylococcales bacterium]
MNFHSQPISFRKYSLIVSYAFFGIVIIIWGMEFYFQTLSGDLTRVGRFSERDFGWNTPQPAIPIGQFKNYSLNEADIVVVGDSFSAGRVWQTKLIYEGLKVSTLTWRELKMEEALPGNLGEALRAEGFKGRYIIIESVERVLQRRAKSLTKIPRPMTIAISVPLPPPMTQRERVSLNKPNGGAWGFKTLYNTLKLSLNLPEKYLKSEWVQPIKFNGCQLFSHRLCNYALFIESDFKKETFTSIANILTINSNLLSVGIQPIWAIVPDKATVYLGYGALNQHPYQNIWQLFSQYPELITPDLGELFIQKSRIIKDFYMPNDTHLSTNGFLYLGDIMLSELRKIQTNQTKPM